MLQRPGVEKGRHVPSPHTALEHAKLSEEEIDQQAAKGREWVQAGMKTDAKK